MKQQSFSRTERTRDDWETPPGFYRALDAEFSFGLDAAAAVHNAKAPRYIDAARDALTAPWAASAVWCNPPYSKAAEFVRKAYRESQAGAVCVLLIPARTDTRYWHDYVMKASEIRLVRGRLRFVGAPSSAPFPSAVIVFRPGWRYPAPILTSMDARQGKEESHEQDD